MSGAKERRLHLETQMQVQTEGGGMERCPGGPAAVAGGMERCPGGPAAVAGATLRALGACQRRLLTLARRAGCEVLRVERRYGELRRPHLQRRGRLIEHIPGFWVTAFLNHPQLSALIDENDEEVFNYMRRLEVEEFEDMRSGYRIKFHFSDNPYFENSLVIKEFHLGTGGRPVSQSTPIRWRPGMELTGKAREPGAGGLHGPARSFFCWFSEHQNPTTDHIAEVLKDDMWPNPLQYFLVADSESGENGLDDSDEENGGDSVVIVDGDDDDDDVQEILEDDEGSDIEEIEAEEEEEEVELVGQLVEAKEDGDG